MCKQKQIELIIKIVIDDIIQNDEIKEAPMPEREEDGKKYKIEENE